ncbi:MAG TPA: hypothetical protein VIO58_07225 [Candidatus Methanoperedens sp.]
MGANTACRNITPADAGIAASTYQSQVSTLLERLILCYDLQNEEKVIYRIFDELSRESLAFPTAERFPAVSSICGDRTPFQFSVSLSRNRKSGRSLRYVTEICSKDMMLPCRVALAGKRIPVLFDLLGAERSLPKINEVLDMLLPQVRLSPEHPTFGIWFGLRHRVGLPSVLKIYCNLLWQLGDPWHMFGDVIRLLDVDANEAVKDIRTFFSASCRPSSISVECSSDGIGGVRIYLRGYNLSRYVLHDGFEKLGLADFKHDYARFHEMVAGSRETYIPRSAVVSIDVPEKPREPYGIKVEVCPRLYLEDDKEINQRVLGLAQELMIDTSYYEKMLGIISDGALIEGAMHYHDVVGIGFRPYEGIRLNIYIRPNLRRYFKARAKT